MGKQSMAWDIGYADYFEGNGANPFEDIHLAQRWFEGWEAARRSHVEESFEEKMDETEPEHRVIIDEAGQDMPAKIMEVAPNGDLWCKSEIDGEVYIVPPDMLKPIFSYDFWGPGGRGGATKDG